MGLGLKQFGGPIGDTINTFAYFIVTNDKQVMQIRLATLILWLEWMAQGSNTAGILFHSAWIDSELY